MNRGLRGIDLEIDKKDPGVKKRLESTALLNKPQSYVMMIKYIEEKQKYNSFLGFYLKIL